MYSAVALVFRARKEAPQIVPASLMNNVHCYYYNGPVKGAANVTAYVVEVMRKIRLGLTSDITYCHWVD